MLLWQATAPSPCERVTHRRCPMKVHDVSSEALASMLPTDLATVNEPPDSPIGEFPFNNSTCGIGCFVGQPPWECHTAGDELLHVLVGTTRLTTIDDPGERS